MNTSDKEKLLLRFSNVFSRLQYKINFDTTNTSSFLLATDLLRDKSKCRLFKLASTNVEKTFLELIINDKQLDALQRQYLFVSLVQQTTQEFLAACYGFKVSIPINMVKESFYTQLLLKDEKILFSVPFQILSKEDRREFLFGILHPKISQRMPHTNCLFQ